MASSKKKISETLVSENPEVQFVDAEGTKHALRQFRPPISVLTECGKRIQGPFVGKEVKRICAHCNA